jgi:hypothetical protein
MGSSPLRDTCQPYTRLAFFFVKKAKVKHPDLRSFKYDILGVRFIVAITGLLAQGECP